MADRVLWQIPILRRRNETPCIEGSRPQDWVSQGPSPVSSSMAMLGKSLAHCFVEWKRKLRLQKCSSTALWVRGLLALPSISPGQG